MSKCEGITIEHIRDAIIYSRSFSEKELGRMNKKEIIHIAIVKQRSLDSVSSSYEELKIKYTDFREELSNMKSYEFTKLRNKLKKEFDYDE